MCYFPVKIYYLPIHREAHVMERGNPLLYGNLISKIRVWFQLQTCFCFKDLVWTLEEVKLDAQKLLVSSKCNHINLQISCLLVDICKRTFSSISFFCCSIKLRRWSASGARRWSSSRKTMLPLNFFVASRTSKTWFAFHHQWCFVWVTLNYNFDVHIYRLEIKLMLPQKFLSHSRLFWCKSIRIVLKVKVKPLLMMLSMTIVTMDHFSLPVVAMDVRVVCIRAFQTLGSGLIVLSFKYFVMWKWIK